MHSSSIFCSLLLPNPLLHRLLLTTRPFADVSIKVEPPQNGSISPQSQSQPSGLLKRRVSSEQLDSPEKRQRIEFEATQPSIPDSTNENLAPQSTDDAGDGLPEFDLDAIIAGAVAHATDLQDAGSLDQVANDQAAYDRIHSDHQLSLQVLSLLSLESLVRVLARSNYRDGADI